jgi:quercetin dioxygenase-like cupin family protein
MSEMHKKLWGSEEWLANTDKYCGKILVLEEGFRCSYHFHKNKDETFYVLDGLVYLNLDGKDNILKPGDSRRVMPGQKHYFTSLEGRSRIIEISTHHEDSDSYREYESGTVDTLALKKRLGLINQ